MEMSSGTIALFIAVGCSLASIGIFLAYVAWRDRRRP